MGRRSKYIRFIILYGLLALFSMLYVGCGKENDADAFGEENIEDILGESGDGVTDSDVRDVVAALTDFISEEQMEIVSPWNSCDDTALAAVMKKAAAGEKVTIACIGGSITQGTIAGGKLDSSFDYIGSYSDIYFKWWEDTFPDTEFEFINAGIGGTDSYLGVHRVQEDVLDFKPDLVLVEYSVNDGNDLFYKKSYDNLVRKILLSENSPAVMLLFMGQTNGTNAQGTHVFIGFNYNIPMISYASLIEELMKSGTYTAEEIAGDGVHPSVFGHAITGEIIWKYLNNVYENLDEYGEPEIFDTKAVTKDAYLDADILDNKNISEKASLDDIGSFVEGTSMCSYYPDGWSCTSGESGITITAEFKNLGVLYLATIDGKSGQFDVYIDGELTRTIDANFKNGWGDAITAKEIYTSNETAVHTITITKSDESTGDIFRLLGFLVS